jgi:hypothetical protein
MSKRRAPRNGPAGAASDPVRPAQIEAPAP